MKVFLLATLDGILEAKPLEDEEAQRIVAAISEGKVVYTRRYPMDPFVSFRIVEDNKNAADHQKGQG